MTRSEYDGTVSNHYASGDLLAAILDGLQTAGKDPHALSIDDLAPVDQFHTGGKGATLALLRLAELQAGIRILDVGGGFGGAARMLATELHASVTVLDLIQEFCDVGEALTQRTGLSDRVTFQQGNALDLPFPAGSFDAVWMQNAGMNIANKERLYDEVFRVLRPGGRFAMQEIVAGPVQPIHYPVNWASSASMNFLMAADELRSLLIRTGFTEIAWTDVTESSKNWWNRQSSSAADPDALPPLGFHTILGLDLYLKTQDAGARNSAEDRVGIIRSVMDRPEQR